MPKKFFAIGLRKPAIAFGDIGGDGERGSIQLIYEKAVTTGKLFGVLANTISEVDRFLVYDQFLEGESHADDSRKLRVDRGEQRKSFVPLTPFPALLSIFRFAKNRGERIRTSDFLVPNQARYQTAPRPVD
jgi:hypothetical protein